MKRAAVPGMKRAAVELSSLTEGERAEIGASALRLFDAAYSGDKVLLNEQIVRALSGRQEHLALRARALLRIVLDETAALATQLETMAGLSPGTARGALAAALERIEETMIRATR